MTSKSPEGAKLQMHREDGVFDVVKVDKKGLREVMARDLPEPFAVSCGYEEVSLVVRSHVALEPEWVRERNSGWRLFALPGPVPFEMAGVVAGVTNSLLLRVLGFTW